MKHYWIAFLSFFIVLSPLCSQEEVISLELRGHLNAKKIDAAREFLESFEGELITLYLDSGSGDLEKVIELSQTLYHIREEQRVRIHVILDREVLGPAALLPFVADQLYSSTYVTWGDILVDNKGYYPVNVLKSRVRSLISRSHPQAQLLQILAEAMSDPALEIVEEGSQWKVTNQASDIRVGRVVSLSGETLVMDHQQLRQLGLVQNWKKKTSEPVVEAEEVITRQVVPDINQEIKEQFDAFIRPRTDKANYVGRIVIGGKDQGIGQDTWIYVKKALDAYKKDPPLFIILELNTPGGEVFASQKISDALKEMDASYKVPIVAFINDWAISAGAMLTFSCRFVAAMPGSSMGAAEPVFAGEGGMQSAPEKVNSALRKDFSNRARIYGRNPYIAEAMVDKDVILVQRHGEVIKLDREEQILRKDKIISAKGKLLTLGAEELLEYRVADFLIPPGVVDPVSSLEEQTGVWPAVRSPLFLHPYFAALPDTYIKQYQMDWQTRFLAFLTRPAVASLLFLGMMLGFYMEINSPGFGLPGSLGLACLFLITLSSFALEAAHFLELIMVVVGAILIAVEVLVLPGMGLVGLLGTILFIGGVFALMLPGIGEVEFDLDSQTLNAAGQYFIDRLTYLIISLLASIAGAIVLGKYVLPRASLFQRLVLQGEENRSEGFVAGVETTLPKIGTQGKAVTTLRPAGKVDIGGVVYDAMSTGILIDRGESVIVAQIDGNHLIVDKE